VIKSRITFDHHAFARKFSNDFIILLLYFEDILIVGKSILGIDKLKKILCESFAMKDLGAAKLIFCKYLT